ncbi:hypothetical protein [Azospirillum doebereinerae]
MAEQNVTITIAGIDRLLDSVMRATKAVAELAAPFAGLSQLSAKLGQTGGIAALTNQFKALGDRIGSVHGRVDALSGAIAVNDNRVSANDNRLSVKAGKPAARSAEDGGGPGPVKTPAPSGRFETNLIAPVARMNAAAQELAAPFAALSQSLGKLARESGVSALTNHFKTMGGQVQAVQGQVTALGDSIGKIAKLGGQGFSFLVKDIGGNVIKASAETETYQTMLAKIMGSGDKAKASMAWLDSFTKKTPYELKDTAEAFMALKNKGIDPMDGSLQGLGDAATTLGRPLKEVVAAFTGGPTGNMDFLKKTFDVKSEIKDQTVTLSFTGQDGRKHEIEAAKDDAQAMQKAMLEVFQAKGFSGAMDNVSKTWNGMWNSLQKSVGDFWGKIGEAGAFEFMEKRLQAIVELVATWGEDKKLENWAKQISDTFIQVFTLVESWVKGVDWSGVWTGLSTGITDFIALLSGAVGAVGGWENALLIVAGVLNAGLISSIVTLGAQFLWLVPLVARVFASLVSILLANPVGAVIGGIAVVIAGAAYAIYQNWDAVVNFLSEAMAAITGLIPDWIKGKLGIAAPKNQPSASAKPPVPPPALVQVAEGPKAMVASAGLAALLTASPAAAKPPVLPPVWELPAASSAVNPKPASMMALAAGAGQPPAMNQAAWGGAVPAPMPGVLPGGDTGAGIPASALSALAMPGGPPSTTVHAPVTVSITVNGVAELDALRQAAEDVVRRALDEWTARQQSDAEASLYDHA